MSLVNFKKKFFEKFGVFCQFFDVDIQPFENYYRVLLTENNFEDFELSSISVILDNDFNAVENQHLNYVMTTGMGNNPIITRKIMDLGELLKEVRKALVLENF